METKSSSLGQKIKRYRLVNDIRQEDMAENIGVSRATLINYEKGHTTINIDVLNRLNEYYPDFESENTKYIKPKIIFENSIDFKVLSDVIVNGRRYIAISTLLFIILGVGSSFLLKKYYKSEISLYPAKNEIPKGLGQFQSLAANLGVNTVNNDQNFNIPDVVKSRLIASEAVGRSWVLQSGESYDLPSLWGLNKVPWYSFFANETDSLVSIEKAIRKFDDHIDVSDDKISGLITISTTFQDPKLSADVANFIGSEVEKYIQRENSAQSKKEKLFISDRLLIVKNELELSEVELKDFKERNRGYQESPELFMLYSQLFREVEAKKQVYLTLQQQLELARIEEVKKSPILHILDLAVPPIKKSHPNRRLILILSAIFGLFSSSLIVIFRY
tara:strand:- start:1194 stop:2360 length:1167 start_codon:yes stop_codon:yes gene_type:complete